MRLTGVEDFLMADHTQTGSQSEENTKSSQMNRKHLQKKYKVMLAGKAEFIGSVEIEVR